MKLDGRVAIVTGAGRGIAPIELLYQTRHFEKSRATLDHPAFKLLGRKRGIDPDEENG